MTHGDVQWNNSQTAWQSFERSGRVSDYLTYKQISELGASYNSREEISYHADYHQWDRNTGKNAQQ